MRDVLKVQDYYGQYYLTWFIDGEEGACIGDRRSQGIGPEPNDYESWQTWIAAHVAREQGAKPFDFGLGWDTRAPAVRALKIIKVMWKNRKTPLPEWAKMALAAGWKPPKNWKP